MNKPVVVYDGECRFCVWSSRRMRKLDTNNLFEYLPRQTQGLEEAFPRLADSDFNTGMRLVVGQDEIYAGADAVYQIYRRLPRFRYVAWLYRVPVLHWIFKGGYALIARYRHLSGRVACEAGTCELSYGEETVARSEK